MIICGLQRTLFLVPVICCFYCACWSYTVTSITKSSAAVTHNNRVRRRPWNSLLLYSLVKETSEDSIISDSDLIQSLIKVKTTRDIELTLRDALEDRAAATTDITQQYSNKNQTTSWQTAVDHTRSFLPEENNLDHPIRSESSSPPLSQLSFNVSAAALRTMARVSVWEARAIKHKYEYDDSSTQILRKQLIISLLQHIGSQVALAQRASSSKETSLHIYALSDILQALAILSYEPNTTNETKQKYMQPLASSVVDMMARQENQELYKLGPIRLVQCLQASAKLQVVDDESSQQQAYNDHDLREMIYKRLLKPDAVSVIPARFLCHGLSALAGLTRNTHSNKRDNKSGMLLTKAFMRRLRKQKVRQDATIEDLHRALVACDQILKNGGMDNFEEEAATFGFTTLRAILEKRRLDDNQHTFSAMEMSGLISSWATLSSSDKEDPVIEKLLEICRCEKILERCNLLQLESIIRSVEQLHVTNHEDTMKLGGEQLLKLVKNQRQDQSAAPYTSFQPKTISAILRCPVLLHRRSKDVMRPYLEASSLLFVDKDFLQRCSVREISNFLWFMSVAHWYHEGALRALGQRILDKDLVDSCSPKLASRILGTYTSVLSMDEVSKKETYSPSREEMYKLTSQLFHDYGGYLLSSQLSPAEVSSALIAYAKASYAKDMGIYDHLVSLIASIARKCTVRQLAQSLWSCGKMIAWESPDYKYREEEGDDEVHKPPYLENAKMIAIELSRRVNEMSPADVTQCIWALGKLEIKVRGDEETEYMKVVSSMANRAKEFAPQLSAIEISNILWGLGKLKFSKESELVSTLTNRLTNVNAEASPLLRVSAKTAATTLYALGTLRFCDEEVFNKLSGIILSQIQDASAQAIANALWAYEVVDLEPPNELLNSWAIQRLGLVGVEFQKPVKQ